MSAEIEYWIAKRSRSGVLTRTDVVSPGSVVPVDFFRKVRLVVGCGIDGNTSGVVVDTSNPNISRRLSARIFRNEHDEKGTVVKLGNGTVSIVKPQELLLVLSKGRRRRSVKELLIYLSPNDETSIEDLPQEKEPVSV